MGYVKVKMDDADKYAVNFLEENKNKFKSVGLIKSFGKRTIDYCLESDGKIVQMFRNPIKVVNHKMGKKTEACKRHNIDCSDIFEAHVKFYSMRYQQFINNSEKYPLYKLEDLSDMIMNKKEEFKFIMEFITGVQWTDKQIHHINNILPCGKSSFSEDNLDITIWDSWNEHQKGVFLEHFEKIMKTTGYGVPL